MIKELNTVEPYFYISKSNSIRFVKNMEGGKPTDIRIDENRMSHQDFVEIPYTQYQIFSNLDNEPTQFKTNYPFFSVKAISPLGKYNLPVKKKTKNMGLKDSRDARAYRLQNGKTGIYFLSGRLYDYSTGKVTGTYNLGGRLPEWAKKGVNVLFDGNWYSIKNIFNNEEKQVKVLEIDKTYSGSTTGKIGVVYNLENYEVYEFVTDMGKFLNEVFTIQIKAENTPFPTFTYQSEKIKVIHDMTDYVEIEYSNDTNTDILYSTGIKFKIWLRLESERDTPLGAVNSHKTDINTILIDGNIHEAKEFVFEPVTRGYFLVIYRAMFHRQLSINKTFYVLSDPPENDGDFIDTNLYSLKAKLIKTSGVFNSRSHNSELPSDGGVIDLPPLLDIGNDGYLKI